MQKIVSLTLFLAIIYSFTGQILSKEQISERNSSLGENEPAFKPVLPRSFDIDQIIDHVLIISDVDGVIRSHPDDKRIPENIVYTIKQLLRTNKVQMAFISGSPLTRTEDAGEWQLDVYPLEKLFLPEFENEIEEGKIVIYGAMGGQFLSSSNQVFYQKFYSPYQIEEGCKILLKSFLEEVSVQGSLSQKKQAFIILHSLKMLAPSNQANNGLANQSPYQHHSLEVLKNIVLSIRANIDPNFRLINRGNEVEFHASDTAWNFERIQISVSRELQKNACFSNIVDQKKQCYYGSHWIKISHISKKDPATSFIESYRKTYPERSPLILAFGDGSVDFPMFDVAHLAFFVGSSSQVSKQKNIGKLPLVIVRDSEGKDSCHVDGTFRILSALESSMGREFNHFPYISAPTGNSAFDSPSWNLVSLNDIQNAEYITNELNLSE